ncbi:MAG: DUF2202 domain-containing protein [Haliscomenobacter sp.]|nr:DUF2202 domain-containing protein [Haliscomenobacter sp.]MBK9488308.1 DUF2202 domain-containing protein [Haliscomenobacter sp.]
MKKILALSILVSAAFALHSQSLIGSQLKSKEAIILYLIEQEKVAHDLYRVLDTMWVTDVFNRVSNEELQHMAKLSAVACEFMIDVPAHFNEYPEGQFVDGKLRRLYTDLLVAANFSLEEAYRACANLEERKILDLKAALREPNFEIETLTYKALLIGAEDNLKLFIRELLNISTGYTPVWLSISEYEALTKNILPNDGWRNTNLNAKSQSRIGLF